MVTREHDDVWVVIPVHNEEKVVAGVVTEVLQTFPNVVCVDDGSRDGSVDEVRGTGAHLVRHPINLGQGAALQTGIRYALDRPGGRYFVTFDADGQHRVADAAAMVEIARGGADVVLGSRFLGSDAATVPPLRRKVLRVVTALSPTARKLRLTDSHNGLRVLGRPAAEALRITQNGMAHASEITTWLGRSSYRVVEAPVTVEYTEYSRAKGQSIINGVNILFELTIARRRR